VPLLHFLAVEIKGRVELVFERHLAAVERSGRLQYAEDLGGMEVLGRGGQQGAAAGQPRRAPRSRISPGRRPWGRAVEFAGASHSVRGAETGLHVLVAGIEM